MKGFFEYLIKIGFVLFVIGVIFYFALIGYIEYREQKVERQEKILQAQSEKRRIENDKLPEKEKTAPGESEEPAYSQCMNKIYREYKTKYDKECSKFIMDGECVLSNEKRYELDGIYMHEQEQCKKLIY